MNGKSEKALMKTDFAYTNRMGRSVTVVYNFKRIDLPKIASSVTGQVKIKSGM